MSATDLGCVKTLPTVVSTQQKNRTCRLGESFMRRIFHAPTTFRLNQSCARTTCRTVFTQPRPISDIGCALRQCFRCRFQHLSKCAFNPIQWCLLSLGTLAETIVTAIGLFCARPCGVDRIATKERRHAPCALCPAHHAAH